MRKPAGATARQGDTSWLTWIWSSLVRALTVSAVWLALTGAPAGIWRYTVPVTVVVVGVSLALIPPHNHHASPLRLLALLPVLAWHALKGGVDVAARALRPNLPLQPDLVEVPLDLRDGSVAIALAFVVTLLPGTLVTQLGREGIVLHVIDRRLPVVATTRAVDRYLRWALAARRRA